MQCMLWLAPHQSAVAGITRGTLARGPSGGPRGHRVSRELVTVGRSATTIGREFGRNGREMNVLLADHGYLDGHPGAYVLTDKGQQYGTVNCHDNGYGGYAARAWEILTWNDEMAAALRADIEANPFGAAKHLETIDAAVLGPAAGLSRNALSDGAQRTRGSWQKPAVAGALVVVGVIAVAPHAKSVWHRKVKPYARTLRAKFAGSDDDVTSPGVP